MDGPEQVKDRSLACWNVRVGRCGGVHPWQLHLPSTEIIDKEPIPEIFEGGQEASCLVYMVDVGPG